MEKNNLTCYLLENDKFLKAMSKFFKDIFSPISHNAFFISSLKGHICVIKCLLLNNIIKDIDIKHNCCGQTALMHACTKNQDKIVEFLINWGADINCKSYYPETRTPLIYASTKGYTKVIKLLLAQEHLNINDVDSHNNTALMLAAINKQIYAIKLLLDKNANVNIKNYVGYTALILATVKNNTKIVKLLLNKNTDVNAINNNGETALMWATIKNNTEIVKLLLDENCDIDIKRKNGDNALDLARKKNHISIINLLIKPRPGYATLIHALQED